MREARKAALNAADEAMLFLRDNEEAEIEIWGARLEDRLPGRERERLVDEFLSQFGFDESYVGEVKEIASDSFSVLPKSCNTLLAFGITA